MATSLSLLQLACGAERIERPAAELGRELSSDPGLSSSDTNLFSCRTCHGEQATEEDRIYPGAPLAGAFRRGQWWGGESDSLLSAVNRCLVTFMSGSPLTEELLEAQALVDYLHDIADVGPTLPWPLQVVDEVLPLTGGQAQSGETLYARACASCHGAKTTGGSKLGAEIPLLPEDVIQSHESPECETSDPTICGQQETCTYNGDHCEALFGPALATVDKVRRGAFFGLRGTMPFFSRQALSDSQLADILAYLGLIESGSP